MLRVIGLVAVGAVAYTILKKQSPNQQFDPVPFLAIQNPSTTADNTGALDTGASWYDYWKAVLSDTYQKNHIMPPQGSADYGTPIPQSP